MYRAHDHKLAGDVALKVPPDELASDPARRHGFEREARAASALNHPNIITIHDIGRQDSTMYIVMELVLGKTLRALLGEGPVPPRQARARRFCPRNFAVTHARATRNVLASGEPLAEAEAAYRRTIDGARDENARLLELRAAVGLARLLKDHNRSREARDLLSPLYGGFTEGFSIRDLKEARALLDVLSSSASD